MILTQKLSKADNDNIKVIESYFFSETTSKGYSPPTYSRARELSESDETFYPPNLNELSMKEEEEI